MDTVTLEGLAARLTRVEKENRRLKTLGLVALVLVAAVVLMGQARPNTVSVESVSARDFTLLDADNNAVGRFYIDLGGKAQFFLHAPGKNFISLSFDDNNGAVVGLGVDTQYLSLAAADPNAPHMMLKNYDQVLWQGP